MESPGSNGYNVESLLVSPIEISRLRSGSDFRFSEKSIDRIERGERDLIIHVAIKGQLKLSICHNEMSLRSRQFSLHLSCQAFDAAAVCNTQNTFESLHIRVPEVLFLAHLSERHLLLASQTLDSADGQAALSILDVLIGHGPEVSPNVAAGLTDCLLVAIGNHLDDTGASAPRSRHFLTRRFAEIETIIRSSFTDPHFSVKRVLSVGWQLVSDRRISLFERVCSGHEVLPLNQGG